MKCAQCQAKFSAADGQPAPGGSSAPGVHVLVALPLYGAAAVTSFLDVAYAPWVCLGIGVFVTLQVPIAWSDCRKNGGTCPKCSADNPVRPWSL